MAAIQGVAVCFPDTFLMPKDIEWLRYCGPGGPGGPGKSQLWPSRKEGSFLSEQITPKMPGSPGPTNNSNTLLPDQSRTNPGPGGPGGPGKSQLPPSRKKGSFLPEQITPKMPGPLGPPNNSNTLLPAQSRPSPGPPGPVRVRTTDRTTDQLESREGSTLELAVATWQDARRRCNRWEQRE